MTQQDVLKLESRTGSGKGVARMLRAKGMIPGVLYGGGQAPVNLAINERELQRLDHGSSRLLTLSLDGKEIPGILREIQHDPLSMAPIHVDFLGVDVTKKITVTVNVVLKGTAIGVKQDAGMLSQGLRHIEIECLPGDIPESVEVDVRELGIGDSIHVSDLKIEKGTFLTPADTVVATVLAPTVEKEPVPGEVAGVEPAMVPTVAETERKDEEEEE